MRHAHPEQANTLAPVRGLTQVAVLDARLARILVLRHRDPRAAATLDDAGLACDYTWLWRLRGAALRVLAPKCSQTRSIE